MGVKLQIGFIGFGEVASTISKKLLDNNVDVITSLKDRSKKTRKLANDLGINVVNNFEEVALSSDILISATSPYESLEVSKKYGTLVDGIFLDLNNISPKTTLEIENNFKNQTDINSSFVKGVIIGKISSEKSVIYVSGQNSNKLSILNTYGFNINVLSHNVVDASYIKMIRSIYTKSLTAITYEAFKISESLSMSDEFFEVLSITEGDNFEIQAKSRINSLKNSHKRKYEEMSEILNFLEDMQNSINNESSNNIKSSNDTKNHNNTRNSNNFKNYLMIEATKNKFKEIDNI